MIFLFILNQETIPIIRKVHHIFLYLNTTIIKYIRYIVYIHVEMKNMNDQHLHET